MVLTAASRGQWGSGNGACAALGETCACPHGQSRHPTPATAWDGVGWGTAARAAVVLASEQRALLFFARRKQRRAGCGGERRSSGGT